MREEKLEHERILRQVFYLNNTSGIPIISSRKCNKSTRIEWVFITDVDLYTNISSIVQKKPDQQKILDLELLSFHYTILKMAVQRLSIPPLAILKSLPDDLPVEIINDLFPSSKEKDLGKNNSFDIYTYVNVNVSH